MTVYGTINTALFDQYVAGWPANAGEPPTAEMLGIASAMPSVERSGQPGSRGGLKAGGSLGSMYLACALRWQGDTTQGCVDTQYFAATGKNSSKQNHMTGLINYHTGGLIERYRVGNTYQVALTDAGVAWVKAINAELGKIAKGFSVEARAKALKAAEKAAKPVKAKARAKRKAKPVVEVDNADGLAHLTGEYTEPQFTDGQGTTEQQQAD